MERFVNDDLNQPGVGVRLAVQLDLEIVTVGHADKFRIIGQ
jgi:hypothetical protein